MEPTIHTGTDDENQDFSYLKKWGPRFGALAAMYVQDKPTTATSAAPTPATSTMTITVTSGAGINANGVEHREDKLAL